MIYQSKTTLIRHFFTLIIFIQFVSIRVSVFSQTNSTSDGNWSIPGNWSSGVPGTGSIATITNNMTLDTDFTINGGNYTVNNGTIIDNAGGGSFSIDLQGGGNFEIGGNVTIEGDFDFRSNGTVLTIKSGDTLRIGGFYSQRNTSTLNIEDGGALIVEGDYTFRNAGIANVDGKIVVGGDVVFRNTASMSGTGNIESDGIIETKNSSSVFGNTGDCDPGPCEEGSSFGLPIVLEYLNGRFLSLNLLEIEWSTVSEINNDYFSVLISENGTDYTNLKETKGAGNTTIKQKYSVVGEVNAVNQYYVKLIQIDFNGEKKEYGPVLIKNELLTKNNIQNLSVYPNPGNGNSIYLKMKNFETESYTIQLLNTSGEQILSRQFNTHNSMEFFELELLNGQTIQRGLYFIRVSSSNEVFLVKHIVF